MIETAAKIKAQPENIRTIQKMERRLQMEGKWIMTVHTFMGDMSSKVECKVDGEVLTGTVEDCANGASANIENGTFKNGEYSYDVTIKTAVGEMTNHLSGKLEGDRLVGKSANPMGEFDADAVRA